MRNKILIAGLAAFMSVSAFNVAAPFNVTEVKAADVITWETETLNNLGVTIKLGGAGEVEISGVTKDNLKTLKLCNYTIVKTNGGEVVVPATNLDTLALMDDEENGGYVVIKNENIKAGNTLKINAPETANPLSKAVESDAEAASWAEGQVPGWEAGEFKNIDDNFEFREKGVKKEWTEATANPKNTMRGSAKKSMTYEVRKKASGNNFASKIQDVTVLESYELEDLKNLKYTFKPDGTIDLDGSEALAGKWGEVYFEINNGSAANATNKLTVGANGKLTDNNLKFQDNMPGINTPKVLTLGLENGTKVIEITAKKAVTPTVGSGGTDVKQRVNKAEVKDPVIINLSKDTEDNLPYMFEVKKEGEKNYFPATGSEYNVKGQGQGKYKVRIKDSLDVTLIPDSAEKPTKYTATIRFGSEDAEIAMLYDENRYAEGPVAPPSFIEPAKKDETKKEEPKKEDPKKEEPKKDDTKTEAPKTEEPKTEEPKTETPSTETPSEEAPVNKTVSSKKTAATVSAEDVALVTGKLTVKVKGATVALPKAVLSDGAVKVSLKAMAPKKDSKDAKALTKNLKKNKLEDKNVYSLSVKSGKKNVKGKFTVTLKTTLKKAPKNLYVMNIANGKLMKAKFSKGKVTFTAGMTGKFVVVSK